MWPEPFVVSSFTQCREHDLFLCYICILPVGSWGSDTLCVLCSQDIRDNEFVLAVGDVRSIGSPDVTVGWFPTSGSKIDKNKKDAIRGGCATGHVVD